MNSASALARTLLSTMWWQSKAACGLFLFHLGRLKIEYDKRYMNVQLLCENAVVPVRSSEGAAGYDLAAVEGGHIEPMGRLLVRTGISIEIPPGLYARVAPRSGLATKYGIHVGAGVIDRDYRGEVRVLLFNFGNERFTFEPGDRIAQLILEKIHTPIVLVKDSLTDTDRGSSGFGSTGL